MANSKKLRAAAAKFRRNNPRVSYLFDKMCHVMAEFILGHDAAEVTCGIEVESGGLKLTCYANS